LELLDHEPGVSSEEVAADSEREALSQGAGNRVISGSKPRRKHPGRQTLPAHLKRAEKIIACTAEQCRCGQCGEATTVIGYEETEVLDVRPAEYFVTVLKREKRACRSCAEQGVETAAAPERIIAKSLFSDQVTVDFIVAKYADSLPVYRQSARLKRDAGLDVQRSTILRCSAACGRVAAADHQCDEARIACGPLHPGTKPRLGCRRTTSAVAIIWVISGSTARQEKA